MCKHLGENITACTGISILTANILSNALKSLMLMISSGNLGTWNMKKYCMDEYETITLRERSSIPTKSTLVTSTHELVTFCYFEYTVDPHIYDRKILIYGKSKSPVVYTCSPYLSFVVSSLLGVFFSLYTR